MRPDPRMGVAQADRPTVFVRPQLVAQEGAKFVLLVRRLVNRDAELLAVRARVDERALNHVAPTRRAVLPLEERDGARAERALLLIVVSRRRDAQGEGLIATAGVLTGEDCDALLVFVCHSFVWLNRLPIDYSLSRDLSSQSFRIRSCRR